MEMETLVVEDAFLCYYYCLLSCHTNPYIQSNESCSKATVRNTELAETETKLTSDNTMCTYYYSQLSTKFIYNW